MSGPASIGGPIGGTASLREIMALRQQVIDRSAALKQVHETPAVDTTLQGPTFAGALQNALSGVDASQHKAENIAAAYERGEVTDVAQVMLARQEASVSFEATLQVRNKLLSAYQDIMRMGV
jgi:flagellar hook-basal body complex protein FliE